MIISFGKCSAQLSFFLFCFFQVLSVISYFGPFTILTFTVTVILADLYIGSAWALIQKKKIGEKKMMQTIYQKNILVH